MQNHCRKCPYWVDDTVGGCYLICKDAIKELVESNVRLVVSLVEDYELLSCWRSVEEYRDTLARHGIKLLRLPIPDGSAPDASTACIILRQVLEFISNNDGRVIFHCYAGQNRTGIMLTAYLMFVYCISLDKALARLWSSNPCAGPIDPSQELFLYYFPLECKCSGKVAQKRY